MTLKAGTRSNGRASVRLAHSQAVSPENRGNLFVVSDLYVDEAFRNKGYASKLMAQICFEADMGNKTLMLTPAPFEDWDGTAEMLQAWYIRRFGFFELQREPGVLLVRAPFRQELDVLEPVPKQIALATAAALDKMRQG